MHIIFALLMITYVHSSPIVRVKMENGNQLLKPLPDGLDGLVRLLTAPFTKINNLKGNLEFTAKYFIEQGENVNYVFSKTKMSYLHFAAGYGTVELMKVFIDYGAKVNVQNFEGNTPLHLARPMNGKIFDKIALLLMNGADIEIKNKLGQRAKEVFSPDIISKIEELDAILLEKGYKGFELEEFLKEHNEL